MTARRKNDRINSIIIYEYNEFSPLASVILFHIKPGRIDHWCLHGTHHIAHIWK